MENTAQTLQSFESNRDAENSDVSLDMTEEELTMFSDNEPPKSKSQVDENSIIVRYSGSEAIGSGDTNSAFTPEQLPDPGYATINEIALLEEKKEKKQERKVSKSIIKTTSPEKSDKQDGIGGPEMGFKPQFHSNPLLKLGGSIPPTPPPTPATAASIAPSDIGLCM